MYEIRLFSELIGATEEWFFEVTYDKYRVLVPCTGHEDIEAQTIADRIGRFLEGM